ncbi:34694_t:CDS:1 [Gigaspora margarita]|uniref:34694_t:CDS:1 n=1 Tax=Gigaspora margarita TaxID=4874 RepID=A0ABN7UHY9_GIGMA|nr:34694_t:CDS:1 [Gigaspora margarita]
MTKNNHYSELEKHICNYCGLRPLLNKANCPVFISEQITASPEKETEIIEAEEEVSEKDTELESSLNQLEQAQDRILDTAVQALNNQQEEVDYWKKQAKTKEEDLILKLKNRIQNGEIKLGKVKGTSSLLIIDVPNEE